MGIGNFPANFWLRALFVLELFRQTGQTQTPTTTATDSAIDP